MSRGLAGLVRGYRDWNNFRRRFFPSHWQHESFRFWHNAHKAGNLGKLARGFEIGDGR